MYVPLAGFEPTTCNIVSAPLYPLSYSGTRLKNRDFLIFREGSQKSCGQLVLLLAHIVSVLNQLSYMTKAP